MFSRTPDRLRSARLAATLAAAAIVLAVLGGVAWHRSTSPVDRFSPQAPGMAILHALPMAEPQQLMPLTPAQAQAANDALPFAGNGLETAPAFRAGDSLADPLVYAAALDCLTAAVYYEAASESEQGQRAVAQVVLNRVRHPAFPARICDVVYQGSERKTGCQFTFTCDGSLTRRPNPAAWRRARQIAANALAGSIESTVGMATHYHADWVAPYWAPKLDKIAATGAHIFYRWKGYWGYRQAFNQSYRGEAATALAALPDAVPGAAGKQDGAPDLAALQAPLAHLSATLVQPSAPSVAEDQLERRLVVDDVPAKLIADGSGAGLPTRSVPAS